MHRQQRGDALQRGAVADAGRHGDDRRAGEAADDAGERALHPGQDDDGVGGGDDVDVGEQAVQPGDADVVEAVRCEAVGGEREQALVGDGSVGRAGGDDEHAPGSRLGRWPVEQAPSLLHAGAVLGDDGLDLVVGCPRQQHRRRAVVEQLADDAHALLRRLARSVDGLGQPLAQGPVVVDEGVADVGERQPLQPADDLVGVDAPGLQLVEQRPQRLFVHAPILPGPRNLGAIRIRARSSRNPRRFAPRDDSRPDGGGLGRLACTAMAALRVGFFGPFGTFAEQALRTQADLAAGELVDHPTVPDVLDAVAAGDVDYGVVPIENSIEGVVNFTQDALAFDYDLLITREIVLDIELCLVGLPGQRLDEVKVVLSIPVATAQCHRFLREHVRAAEILPASSTAEAARQVADAGGEGTVAIAPRVAAARYGLEVLEADIADHAGNQTRFVVVARDAIPARTGHDRTAMVVFQRADEPGSLISILQEFAARRINLSNLLSRPTKDGGLGDYCFVIYADAHLDDELMADALRALHAKQGAVKFLGSYPVAGEHAHSAREHADARWRSADDWVTGLRRRIQT